MNESLRLAFEAADGTEREELAGQILEQAARENNLEDCLLAFGESDISYNTEALLTAAQNKSYAVFNGLLANSDVDLSRSFQGDAKFRQIEKLAKTDEKLGTPLERFFVSLTAGVNGPSLL
jgi:hypothetical protein